MKSTISRSLLAVVVGLLVPTAPLAAEAKGTPPRLNAEQVVRKHVEARGGQDAWHAVQSMAWSGQMDIGPGDSAARSARYVKASNRKSKAARSVPAESVEGAEQVQVPFVLETKRPGMSRIEIEFAGKTAVQVFDGAKGWLLRPYLNRQDWEPFTADQARSYQGKGAFEDPLIDAAAKGTRVQLVSMDRVDGREAYKLKLVAKDGGSSHVWIDAQTFLDVKVEGEPRRMDGKMRTVWVTQRDFRPVQGVMVPFLLETSVEGFSDTHRIVVEQVALNPPIDDARFTRPRT